MGGEGGLKGEVGMIKLMTLSTERTRKNTSVFKNNIQSLISRRLNNIKKTMTRAQVQPVLEQA